MLQKDLALELQVSVKTIYRAKLRLGYKGKMTQEQEKTVIQEVKKHNKRG